MIQRLLVVHPRLSVAMLVMCTGAGAISCGSVPGPDLRDGSPVQMPDGGQAPDGSAVPDGREVPDTSPDGGADTSRDGSAEDAMMKDTAAGERGDGADGARADGGGSRGG